MATHEPFPAPEAESLHLSEQRFRLLVDSVRDYAVFMLDPSGHILTWNSGAERLKGYLAHEVVGRHFSIFYPQEAIDRRWPDYELSVAGQEGRFEDEGWRVRKDGTRFWANVVISAIRDSTGELSGFAKVTRDLTERREQEERVRESEERFRLLVDGVREYAIFMLDPTGRVVSWNRGAERINGYAASEVVGQHFAKFYSATDLSDGKPDRELRDALRLGSVEDEGWRMRKDGTRFWASVTVTALFDSKGRHRGYANITRDLTQRRRVEALEESNRRINEFLAMLAHELRNPLAPIRNAVSVLQTTPPPDDTTAWARGVIDRQLEQLTRLVDDLLDISRITSGKITLRLEEIDASDIVERAVEAARPLLDARRHTLTITSHPGPLVVKGDATRLSQVIVNLLNNAAKYTPEGGDVVITTREESRDAVISVRDNGVGIPPHLMPHIFDLFAQGDRSLARSEGGLGIGLTIARQLVNMHGGSIEAKSDGLNRGAEFSVRIPLLASAGTATTPPASAQRTQSIHCRVLVVDDNEDSAQTMAMLLSIYGHQTQTASSGRDAIEMARRFRPHVVLLDIGLPEMDGYEVGARIRDIPELRGVRLIAMTGYGQDEDRRRSTAAGFAYHLVKPVDPIVLERVIASAACDD